MKIDWPIELSPLRCLRCNRFYALEGELAKVRYQACPYCEVDRLRERDTQAQSEKCIAQNRAACLRRSNQALRGQVTRLKRQLAEVKS